MDSLVAVRTLFTHPSLSASGKIQRIYMIDLARGLAAIAILIWHYQHFFFLRPEKPLAISARPLQPFYAILEPFYEQGQLLEYPICTLKARCAGSFV